VKPREAVYEGANVGIAPNVVLFPREFRYDVSGSIANTFRSNPHKNHKPGGLFLTDRAPDPGADLERASIHDVAPTVAACLGLPIDADADGAALPLLDWTVERAAWADLADPHRTIETDRTEGDVERRLADLGYME
jgi:hypothetical protein